jgi:hypothetical protein
LMTNSTIHGTKAESTRRRTIRLSSSKEAGEDGSTYRRYRSDVAGQQRRRILPLGEILGQRGGGRFRTTAAGGLQLPRQRARQWFVNGGEASNDVHGCGGDGSWFGGDPTRAAAAARRARLLRRRRRRFDRS